MSKCIQFKIGTQVFKFEDVDLDNTTYNLRSILGTIAKDNRYLDQVGELINVINDSKVRSKKNAKVKDASEFADTVLGDITPLGLSTILRDYGSTSKEVDALVSLISKKDESIIKINNELSSPVIYIGSNRTIISSSVESLAKSDLIQALSYVYLDSKIRNTASIVSKTLTDLFYEFKEKTLKDQGIFSTKVLKELDSLDSVNRNKRLLSYIFNESLRKENLDLFDKYSKHLQSIVTTAIDTRDKVYKARTDISLYSLISLNSTKEVSLSENVKAPLNIVTNLLKDIRTKDLKMTLVEAANIFGRPSETTTKTELVQDIISKFLAYKKDGAYDESIFKRYTPSQLVTIYNNADILYELFDTTKGKPEHLDTILQDIIIENRTVQEGELPLSNVNVKFGNSLFVTPSRRILFDSFGKDPVGSDKVLTIEISPKLQTAYSLHKNVLKVNPKRFNHKTKLEFEKFPTIIDSVYIPYSGNNTELYIEILNALVAGNYIREFKTDGLEEQSVRLAIEANNLGLSIMVHPKDGKFKSTIDGPVNLDQLAERFNFIQPLLPGALKPKMKFYDEKSSNGYEFTNKKGRNNLNETLAELEKALPDNEFLDYFNLVSEGKLNSLIVSKKTADNGILIDSAIGSKIELHDTKSERFNNFHVIDKYRLDGKFESNLDSSGHNLGAVWQSTKSPRKFIVCKYNPETQEILGIAYITEKEMRVVKLNKDQFSEFVNTGLKLQTYKSPDGVSMANFKNKLVIYENGKHKAPEVNDLYDFYNKELNNISKDSGFSLDFLRSKKFPTIEAFNNSFIIKLEPVKDDLNTKQEPQELKNFSGSLFIERLAHKLNTPVHFINTNQLAAINANFRQAKAIIYNGEIYVNSDSFSDNRGVLLHELSHIILAYVKENDYNTYIKLLDSLKAEGAEFDALKEKYPELTNQDLREEFLAEKFSKSFDTLFVDPKLDKQLSSLEFVDAITKFLELSTDITDDMRTLMTSTLSEIAKNSDSNSRIFGNIFKKTIHDWGLVSNLKSKLLQSTDNKNKLIESNCR